MAVAAPPFAGFSPDAIQFLADLAENNDRAWFQPRKAEFERLLKEPMEAMIAALADALAARGVPMLADPKRSPFRIYRDTRFSKDKSPYKTHIGASSRGSRPGPAPTAGGRARRARPRQRRLLPLPAGRDVRRRRDVADGEAAARGLPARGRWPTRIGSAPRSRTQRSSPWFGTVRPHDELKRFPPGYPQDHPHGRDVPLEGRRLRATAVRRRGPLADLPDRLAEGYATATSRSSGSSRPSTERQTRPTPAESRRRPPSATLRDARALNRALLARQLLLERATVSTPEAARAGRRAADAVRAVGLCGAVDARRAASSATP